MKYQDARDNMKKNKLYFNNLLKCIDRPGIDNLLKYLNSSTFFTDPASSNHHNAFDGGLADHSLKVYEILTTKLLDRYHGVLKVDQSTAILVSLLHDVCKISNYCRKQKWRKDKDNKWESYNGYGYSETYYPYGHGEKSVDMIRDFIHLTEEEKLAIRWHMGSYDDSSGHGFNSAMKACPLALLLHHADMQASNLLEPMNVVEEWVLMTIEEETI